MQDAEENQDGVDRGAGDRRQNDRRRGDRRNPAPLWRRPWAYAAYGVLGALLVVLLLTSLGDDEEGDAGAPLAIGTAVAPPSVDPASTPASAAPIREGFGVGEFERLLAEGEAAAGQRVRALLYCEPTSQISLRDVDEVARSVAALADAQRRVPAAECKWGADAGAPDFLLLVPPQLAERFAAAPEVQQGFIRRRRVPVVLEWLGRRDALALRTAGVLRTLE